MKLAGVLWNFFGLMLGLFFYMFLLTLIKAVTVVILWGWFVVPLGVVGINVWWAVGLLMLIGIVTFEHNSADVAEVKKVKDPAKMVRLLLSRGWNSLLICGLTIAFGAVYHGLM